MPTINDQHGAVGVVSPVSEQRVQSLTFAGSGPLLNE
jgi:hypothetical protein